MGNCVLILQSCTNSPKYLAGLCSQKSATMSGDAHESVRIKVEASNMDIKEEMAVIKFEEDTFVDIKEEEISVEKFEEGILVDPKEEDSLGGINTPTVKAEQDPVSYNCVCPILDTLYEYPILYIAIYCVDLCLSVSVNKYNSFAIVKSNTSAKI